MAKIVITWKWTCGDNMCCSNTATLIRKYIDFIRFIRVGTPHIHVSIREPFWSHGDLYFENMNILIIDEAADISLNGLQYEIKTDAEILKYLKSETAGSEVTWKMHVVGIPCEATRWKILLPGVVKNMPLLMNVKKFQREFIWDDYDALDATWMWMLGDTVDPDPEDEYLEDEYPENEDHDIIEDSENTSDWFDLVCVEIELDYKAKNKLTEYFT